MNKYKQGRIEVNYQAILFHQYQSAKQSTTAESENPPRLEIISLVRSLLIVIAMASFRGYTGSLSN